MAMRMSEFYHARATTFAARPCRSPHWRLSRSSRGSCHDHLAPLAAIHSARHNRTVRLAMKSLSLSIIDSLRDVPAASWNALIGDDPLLSHAFLHALHETGCASPKSGWAP